MNAGRFVRGAAVLAAMGWLGPVHASAPVYVPKHIVVTSTADDGSDGALCTLREAIGIANGQSESGTGCTAAVEPSIARITFDVTGTITLGGSQINLSQPVVIDGPGASLLAISGGDVSRIFALNTGSAQPARFSGLTLTHGNPGDIDPGGAIHMVSSTLTLSDMVISGNVAGDDGGAIFATMQSDLTLFKVTLSGNSSGHMGGAIALNSSVASLENSTLSGNHALVGGAVVSYGSDTSDLVVTASTLSGNSAGGATAVDTHVNAGALSVQQGFAMVSNSTISGNSGSGAYVGGGISVNNATLTLNNSTVTANLAQGEVSVDGVALATQGHLIASHSIITAAQGDTACVTAEGASISGDFNFGTDSSCGNTSVVSATTLDALKLGPLADNGGATFTHALLPGSVALDVVPAVNGESFSTCAGDTSDQRGIRRPQMIGCDIGAYELLRDSKGDVAPVIFNTDSGLLTQLGPVATPAAAAAALGAHDIYPFGFFGFKVIGLRPGQVVHITLTLPAGTDAAGYVKCNAAGADCARFAGAVISANRITLTLTEGDPASDSDADSSTLTDPGAPVVIGGSGGSEFFNGMTGNGGALNPWSVLLLGAFGLLARRRRAFIPQ